LLKKLITTTSDFCTKNAFQFTLQYAFSVPKHCRYKIQTTFNAVQLIYRVWLVVLKTQNQITPPKRYWHNGYKNVPSRIHVI